MRSILSLLVGFLLLIVGFGCYSGPEYAKDPAPEVGPVAAALDGSIDADPLAAEIDLSNEEAEEAVNDPLYEE